MIETLHTGPPVRDQLMTIEEVVELLRMPVATLPTGACSTAGPRASSSDGAWHYWRDDVMTWLDAQRDSTGSGAA